MNRSGGGVGGGRPGRFQRTPPIPTPRRGELQRFTGGPDAGRCAVPPPLRTVLKGRAPFLWPSSAGSGPSAQTFGEKIPVVARFGHAGYLFCGFASRLPLRSPPSCTRRRSLAEPLGAARSSRPRSRPLRAVAPHTSPHTIRQCHASPPASPTVGRRALALVNGLRFDLIYFLIGRIFVLRFGLRA